MAEKPYRVLAVDDDFASLEVLALLLRSEGFEVIAASNGEEALAQMAQATVDLVITDYKMPVMDGGELCLSLLADQQFAKIPVIFTSATYRHGVPRPSNVAAFFNKPLLFKELLRAVREILGGQVTPPLA
ncbi:MAG: response regulator [Pseudomonadota bacterium]